MSKTEVLKFYPKANLKINSEPHWTGIRRTWWSVSNGVNREIGKGSTASNAWRSAFRKIKK